MHLDVPTMIFMLVVVLLLLAGILAVTSLHAGNIKGIKSWAAANLFMGLGFSFTFSQIVSESWLVVIGITIMMFGVSLQYSGIQAFKYGQSSRQFPFAIAILVFLYSYVSTVILHDLEVRVFINSLLLIVIYSACAKQLLIRIEPPLRTAYWLSGLSFVLLAVLIFIRSVFILSQPPGHYHLLAQIPINHVSFFLISLIQLIISFGFVLMINYTLANKLERLASTDELTGLLNRRALDEVANRLCAKFMRSGHDLSVLMLDIDHFKEINDNYGHPAGDQVLQKFANIAQSEIRYGDYVGRYGGEEFCIVLPDTSASEAMVLAERLRKHYANTAILNIHNQPVYSTVSIGVVDSQKIGTDFKLLIKVADNALYQAKTSGRNKTCIGY